jgi:hypothetical protein
MSARPHRSRYTAAIRRAFHLPGGLGGAAVMSALVWFANAAHGPLPAAVAGGKQAAYTFLFGGLVTRLCVALAEREGTRARRMTAAILVPSAITIAAVFAVHSVRGTPEPLLSTLPTVLLGPPSFAVFAWRAQATPRDGAACAPAVPPALG